MVIRFSKAPVNDKMRCFKYIFFVHLIFNIFSSAEVKMSCTNISNRDFSNSKWCVRKCCPENEGLFYFEKLTCKELNSSDPFVFYNNTTLVSNISKNDYFYIYGRNCPGNMVTLPTKEFYLQTNGLLLLPGLDEFSDEIFSPEHYCVDTISNESVALLCTEDEQLEMSNTIVITGW